MDPKSRILPHLNAYFLQRKAYEQHRKKIDMIRGSIPKSKTKRTEEETDEKGEEASQIKQGRPPLKYSIHTIKQEIKNELSLKLSPWAKRIRDQTQKQNNRLHQRIQKCSSTISRKQIQNHRIKNEEMKERLSKFIYSPYSHKTLLKCKYSLEILRQKEKQKDGLTDASRNISRLRYSRSDISHGERYASSDNLNFQTKPIEKKASLDRFYLLRNRTKIRSHFGKKDDLHSSTKEALHESAQLDSKKRVKTQVRRSRNKCFTTEIEGE